MCSLLEINFRTTPKSEKDPLRIKILIPITDKILNLKKFGQVTKISQSIGISNITDQYSALIDASKSVLHLN